MVDLATAPYHLSPPDIAWVIDTLERMTQEDKIGQLFCLTPPSPEAVTSLIQHYHPGAIMHRAAPAMQVLAASQAAQEMSAIPLLVAANLESGGNGVALEGTHFAKQMQVAATDDVEHARRLGYVCAKEGAAVGCNWNFGPLIDVDYNWRNPITNVRSFGSDPGTVKDMALAFCQGMRECEPAMIACVKHFPGDGVDERDQHLTPTFNSFSAAKWRKTYGKVWKSLIRQGVLTAMTGHILQPALSMEKNPALTPAGIFPASTSHELVQGVLRDELGFQGMLITDATPMVGYQALRPRAECLRMSIAAGIDMILFTKNIDEDYQAIRDGLHSGQITPERLDEAVTRILGVKAAARLHHRKQRGTLAPSAEGFSCLGCDEHTAWARQCAQDAITMVKDNQNLLPLSPEKTPRIRLIILGEKQDGSFSDNGVIGPALQAALKKQGFLVSVYQRATLENGEIFTSGVADMKGKFDLAMVVANVGTGSNHTTRRLEWITLMAADAPWYVRDIPTLLVSFANPYHLADAPYISTVVNCYSSNEYCVDAFVEKAMGRSPFTGKSPVDPFCGMLDAKIM